MFNGTDHCEIKKIDIYGETPHFFQFRHALTPLPNCPSSVELEKCIKINLKTSVLESVVFAINKIYIVIKYYAFNSTEYVNVS